MKKELRFLLVALSFCCVAYNVQSQAQLRAEGGTLRIVCSGSPFIVLNNMGYANNASSNLFTAATSEVQFTGNTTVNVTSTAGYDTRFYNMEINKTGGSEIDVLSDGVELEVQNNLEMIVGNIDMNNNLNSTIILGISTAVNGTLVRTTGHVYNGFFKRWYNTSGNSDIAAWDIPIGMSATNYNMARVWYPSGSSTGGSLRARFVSTNPMYSGLPLTDASNTSCYVGGQPIDNVANEGYWEINPGDGWTSAQTDLYSIRLNYTGITTVNNANCLGIVKSENHTSWMLEGSHGGVTPPTVRRNGQAGWSWFTIGSEFDINPLPVELISFDVNCTNNATFKIEWATASETNNDYFTLERSKDAQIWETIASIDGAGNSNQLNSYTYEDGVYNSGYYYRLSQTDYDNTTQVIGEKYKVCTSDVQTLDVLSAFQNPSGSLTVIANFPVDMAYQIEVYDLRGRKLNAINSHATAGTGHITLDIASLRSSIYLIALSGNETTITRKVFVEQKY
ncbi:MAG: T9SS type A sorting domain-containing protein [Candidatus Competibacteraceae bacterium]|nr:T9SS type A sorting domain-containing protein [Candidatus Competibacteraceae bacterium]